MPIILDGTTGITTPGITNTGTFVFQGPVQVPAGSAATASITTAAGANTGIFFPSSSSVAITTAGTQRFVVSASGDVGIGTTTPGNFSSVNFGDSILDVNGAIQVRGDATNGIAIFQLGGDTFRKAIIYSSVGTDTPYLAFGVATSGSSSTASEYARITSGGDVGIGTSSPSQKLEVAGAAKLTGTNLAIVPSTTTSAAYLVNTNAGGNFFVGIDNSTGGSFGAGAYGRILYSGGAYPMVFYTNDTERARITSGGDFGIGTTSPGARLDVVGSGTTPPTKIYTSGTSSAITSYSATAGLQLISYQSDTGPFTKTAAIIANADGTAPSLLQFWTKADGSSAPTERARITSNGDFSIPQSPGRYTVDTAGGATNIANGGTVDFSTASGMLVVNDWGNGGVTIYLCGGGNVTVVSSVIGQVGTLAYNAGINGYRWTNNTGVTKPFGFFFARTRSNA